MRAVIRFLVTALLIVVVSVVIAIVYVKSTGLRGQPEPGRLETRIADAIRGFAIPREMKKRTNPLEPSKETLSKGMDHFARYCAMCHANDGSGKKTPIGSGLYPKPPDLRDTQDLTDG